MTFDQIDTPAYVCDLELLKNNLEILKDVQDRSGAKIILALKGFAMWSTFDLVNQYLHGCTASGLNEAKLALEKFGGEIHTYSPAFKYEEIREIASISDHIVFNSSAQLNRFKDIVKDTYSEISISLRINPEISASPKDIYNPCSQYSRLGITYENFNEDDLEFIDGFNFHALCEQGADELELVLKEFEKNFSKYFKHLKYLNFGGGHMITKKDYDIEKLITLIKYYKDKYNLDIYLEPGEAVGFEVGYLVSSVLDIVENEKKIAILDTSAEAHMPDTLAMPYKAEVRGSMKDFQYKNRYILAGNTCLAGDIMGEYCFENELKVGDKIIFEDQIHYTFVKNTTFNGINLPSLVLKDGKEFELVKSFGYKDYKERLS